MNDCISTGWRLWRLALLAVLASTPAGLCAARGGRRAAAPTANPLQFAAAYRCTSDPGEATTVPGWITVAGSPALRCADSLHAAWPGMRPRVAISSGPFGRSSLQRMLNLPGVAATGSHVILSAWFAASGRTTAHAVVRAQFLGAAGRILGRALELDGPPAAAHAAALIFTPRRAVAKLPPGTAAIRLRVELDGVTAGTRSYVAALNLRLTPPVNFAPPLPPRAAVPRFDHVFLIMMENTDFRQVIGDRKDAPFINALAARGALLANYQAVYHPSDENYLAIAGGDTFARNGAYFPGLRVTARNLGDLLERADLSWKTYEQGMGTPCNTTTRYDRNYEPDDTPFILFSDIRDDPLRCRAHLVGMHQWPKDLRRAGSTPAFAWLAADDYNDGEASGNGSPASLRVQDAWLKHALQPLFDSPAWRTQKSLLILTWDESDTTSNDHVATIVVGSKGTVKAGYVSRVRYDHYSTARTIEAALDLPAMTSNDGFARPFNDVFTDR